MIDGGLLDVLGVVTPLGILTLMVYLGFRVFSDLVALADKHLETLESLFKRYLDIIESDLDKRQ